MLADAQIIGQADICLGGSLSSQAHVNMDRCTLQLVVHLQMSTPVFVSYIYPISSVTEKMFSTVDMGLDFAPGRHFSGVWAIIFASLQKNYKMNG